MGMTHLAFWRLMTRYGGADLYCTEYFRVHADSRLDPDILASITENPLTRRSRLSRRCRVITVIGHYRHWVIIGHCHHYRHYRHRHQQQHH